MVEPRLPEPMTPGRADVLAVWWRLAATVSLAAGTVLTWAGVPYAMPVALVAVALCLLKRREYLGWRDGYRAARTEDLRREAGELL